MAQLWRTDTLYEGYPKFSAQLTLWNKQDASMECIFIFTYMYTRQCQSCCIYLLPQYSQVFANVYDCVIHVHDASGHPYSFLVHLMDSLYQPSY